MYYENTTLTYGFLGAFEKSQKAIISFFMYVCLSVCLSIRPHGTTGFPLDGFS
jgi:hypothetical protein